MPEYVSFSVEGEFITNLAREWYYEDKKPYCKVEELLLSCMCGTNQSKEELKKLAKGIVIGRYKFIGNTRDGSFGLEEDNEFDPTVYFEQDKEELKDYKKLLRDISEEKQEEEESIGSQMLDSFLKASKHDDNYGYILPDGRFIPVEWGRHHEYAKDAIEKHGWQEEFEKKMEESEFNYSANTYQTDFLIFEKGWVLLHNPSQGVAAPTFNISMSKAQKDFLFKYYTDRNELELAQKYWEE